MKLKDKSALITGAASGIGKDIALLFAREGAKLAVADLDRNAADVTAAQISAAGGQAIGIAMDVTDENTVGNGVAAVIDAFSSVDISATRAFRSSIRSKSSRTLSGRRCWRSISTVRS